MTRRDERGLVLPSWAVAASAVAVALALVGFGISGERDPEVTAADGADPAAAQSGTQKAAGGEGDGQHAGQDRRGQGGGAADGDQARDEQRDREPVERRSAYVEVYNNSGITGLAGETTATLQDMGWQVVATDNWYGEIPADTVYRPAGMEGQARLLADDLGVERVMPAVAPMSFDGLTVILTGTG